MSNEKQVKIFDKESYLRVLDSNLSKQERLVELISQKMILLTSGIDQKTQLEKVEIEIQLIKLESEKASIEKAVEIKRRYYAQFLQEFSKQADEALSNWEQTVHEAKNSEIKTVKELISRINWEKAEEFIEVKVRIYMDLRKHLNRKK